MKYGSGYFSAITFSVLKTYNASYIYFKEQLIPCRILNDMPMCNAYLLSMDEPAGTVYSSLLDDSWN